MSNCYGVCFLIGIHPFLIVADHAVIFIEDHCTCLYNKMDFCECYIRNPVNILSYIFQVIL